MSRVQCIPGRGHGSESEEVFGQTFWSERPSGGGPESEARPSGRRGGPESEASAIPVWLGLPDREAGRSQKRALFLFGQALRLEIESSF